MRRAVLWLALLISIVAGVSIAWFVVHQMGGPSAAAKPAESSLLRASRMPLVTAPVMISAGYEAAAWDTTGRVTFWKWTNASQRWAQVGASTYPRLPASFGTPSTEITGALLTGMSDATFIAKGQFSGDGTGSFIAFTNGPRGWGTIAPARGQVLIPTGKRSTDNRTPGNSYTELFRNGRLVISGPGTLPFGPNGEEWQIERTYAWKAGEFHEVSSTQFTATLASPLPATAPAFPAVSCRRVRSGTYKSFAVSAFTTFTNHASVSRPYLPASVVLHVQGDGPIGGCNFTVKPDFPVVISTLRTSGPGWITAPAWVLTGGANGNQDIRNLLPGAQLPGQYGVGTIEFQDAGSSPYYIPKSLGIRQIGQLGSPVIRIHEGQLTAMTLLST